MARVLPTVVKVPHIEIRGESLPPAFLELVSNYFHKPVRIIPDPDDETVDITQTEWYKKARKEMTPGCFVSAERWKVSMTQKQLSALLGISAQNVSEIERSKRSVSLKMAHKLAKIFKTDLTKFLVA
jgi:DNA-binding XRE family transcriptional regulator